MGKVVTRLEKRLRRPKVLIWLAAAGIVIFLFWPMTYFSQVLHGNYNPLAQTVSRLELGPGSMVEKVGMFLAGICIIAFTTGLYIYVRPPRGIFFTTGIILSFMVGGATEAIAFVPPGTTTSFGPIHYLLAGTIFTFLPMACFLQLPKYRRDNWYYASIHAAVAGVLGIVFIIMFINAPGDMHGLAERLILLNGMAWCGGMGSYIIYHIVGSRKNSEFYGNSARP